MVAVAVEDVVVEETITSEWRNAGWEAGVEEDTVVVLVDAVAAEDVGEAAFTAESRYHKVLI